MKKIFILIIVAPLLLISCSKHPVADFVSSATELGIGDVVYFTNRSLDAESFEWDFGDGHTSTSFNASNYYDFDGIYNVQLKAFSNNRVDIAYLTVTVLGASLEITVEEYDSPFLLVEDVSVILYPSIADWENYTNPSEEKFTNSSGVVRFDHLAPHRYYVDVWGPNHGNMALAEEDVTWIESPVLEPGEIKPFIAVVYYYPLGKKSGLGRSEEKTMRKAGAAGEGTVKKALRK